MSPENGRGGGKKRKRDGIVPVGGATRDAIATVETQCGRFELRCFLAVLWMTTTYSKLVDTMAVSQVAAIVYGIEACQVTRAQRDRVSKALRRLADRGAITYEPGLGRYRKATIGLPSMQPPGGRIADVNASIYGDVNASIYGASMRPSTARQCVPLGGHSEEYSEKYSEKYSEEGGDERDLESTLADGLALNGPAPFLEECRGVIARARGLGLTDDAIADLIDEGIEAGDAFPSHARKRLDAAADELDKPPQRSPCPDHPDDPRCSFVYGIGWIHPVLEDEAVAELAADEAADEEARAARGESAENPPPQGGSAEGSGQGRTETDLEEETAPDPEPDTTQRRRRGVDLGDFR